MRRGTIFILLFVVVAAAIIGASQFIGAQPPLEITIAVNAIARPWVENVVYAFNETTPIVNGTRRVRIKVTEIDDLDVWLQGREWTPANHPAAWIPASSLSVNYAVEAGLPLQTVAESVMRTPLVWGGFSSRVDVLTGGAAPLDWPQVAAAAAAESWSAIGGQANWQFVKLAFAQPTARMSGLAAMLSGAAAFNESAALTADSLRAQAFRNWMQPVISAVPNFNNLGANPAAVLARQGPSSGEIGLLPESEWLINLSRLVNYERVVFSYPAYQVMLDFPLARWDDSQTTGDERAAVDALRDWLLNPDWQIIVPQYGLRSAVGDPTEDDTLFAEAVPYGIQLSPDFGQMVQPPARADVQGFVSWIASN
ncbi:MAG: substrate-binding domain-containing protein [Chloroflexi bacterium]|nr:substrate-binding domain-containing protein [Chloroflexota bacterium]